MEKTDKNGNETSGRCTAVSYLFDGLSLGGNNGWERKPWPAWSPMYWMDEMAGATPMGDMRPITQRPGVTCLR